MCVRERERERESYVVRVTRDFRWAGFAHLLEIVLEHKADTNMTIY